MTAVSRVIQKIALLTVVFAGRGGGLALRAVKVDLLGHVAQVLRVGQRSRPSKASLDGNKCRKVAGWRRNVCTTPNGYSGIVVGAL